MSQKWSIANEKRSILFFDGYCNLCSGWVQFVMRYGRNKDMYFSSLQSPVGQQLCSELGLPTENLSTLVYLHNGIAYQQSDGVLMVVKTMRATFSSLWYLIYIPRGIRDTIYRFVARNRFRFFGKKESCYVPSESTAKRFIN